MRISELQELLEKAKEEFGDVDIEVCNIETNGYYDIDCELGQTYRSYSGGFIPVIHVS